MLTNPFLDLLLQRTSQNGPFFFNANKKETLTMTYKMSYSYNEEQKAALMHYGVLGMRWGIRKDRELKGRKKPPT